jgi:hypothetical protein
MFKRDPENSKNRLNYAGRRIVSASGLPDEEVDRITSSPFLLTRIRARIASDSTAQEADLWSSLGLVSRRAIPAMGLAAAISLGLFFYVNGNKSSNVAFSVDAYLSAGDSGIDNLVIAEKRLTDEEVLRTVVSRDDREAAK